MQFLTDYTQKLKQQNLCREIEQYESIDAAHVKYSGKTYLNLASNNYLGLTHCPAVMRAAVQAIRTGGTGAGAARLITGNHPYYTELEQDLAAFKHTEAVLVFNTGYMANIGVISALAEPDDVIFSDESNHASIIDGCRLTKTHTVIYRHTDMAHLAHCLQQVPCKGKRLIITDGIFSMDGDIAPLPQIVELAEKYSAIVMVDDAHATGVIGPGGRGTAAYYGLNKRIPVQIGTLSKALGSEGGFVAGSHALISYLCNRARSFIFTTGLSPSSVAAAQCALRELTSRPDLVETLQENTQIMRQGLIENGLPLINSTTPIIPVMVGSAQTALTLAANLKNDGLIISAIRPPTVPTGGSRLRIAISAAHHPTELAAAAKTIAAAARRLKII